MRSAAPPENVFFGVCFGLGLKFKRRRIEPPAAELDLCG
jgi:hypothetical protein